MKGAFSLNLLLDTVRPPDTPTPWAQGLRDQIQKRVLQRQEILYALGLQRSEGGWRPWSRKGPDHGVGADPSLPRKGFSYAKLVRVASLVDRRGGNIFIYFCANLGRQTL